MLAAAGSCRAAKRQLETLAEWFNTKPTLLNPELALFPTAVGGAVAKAVQDSVAEGVIPAAEADDLFICVGVFIHWEAEDDKKIQDFNYRATKEAIARAIAGEPKAAEATKKRDSVKHPFGA